MVGSHIEEKKGKKIKNWFLSLKKEQHIE